MDAAWWYSSSAGSLRAKQAASKIKQMRTGKTPQEGLSTLYERLMKTVGDFRVDYPGASLRYVERELEFALEEVRYLRIHTRGG